MKSAGELERENEALRDRLSRLSQASLRINESLDFEGVLQEVVDSARAITDARLTGAVAPAQSLNRWPSPMLSANAMSALRC